MEWDVQLDDDFAAWLAGLEASLRAEIVAHANLLREHGPQLGRPHVDTLEDSDLLVSGNKRGDKRWYKNYLPIADERFRRHLKRLEQ